jgi:hypothetical protein
MRARYRPPGLPPSAVPPKKFNVRKAIPGPLPAPIPSRSPPPREGGAGMGSGSVGGERRLNSLCISCSENRFALFGLMQSAATQAAPREVFANGCLPEARARRNLRTWRR